MAIADCSDRLQTIPQCLILVPCGGRAMGNFSQFWRTLAIATGILMVPLVAQAELVQVVASRSYDEDYGQYMEKELYVNPKTIRRSGPFAWWEVEAVNRDSTSKELRYHARAYYSGDCSRRVTRLREISVFILNGENTDFYKNYGDQGEVNTVSPGSTGASLLDFVCGNARTDTAAAPRLDE
ncbi:hypothetical protein AWQ21_04920 [Picosynechococcus sp. PCC 7003]|uniref:surface-adhesin E family protein n=1 Tax=Picosynechococcus sp. PCC 7003 TaxID=374981 RepID=UPI000810E8CE|nr:surface-adhesin E family protein [Picosynechococcus sp. PCC 7003]ANV83779.1 hypothetical protein AWQ21_04920 [Picosynechococcus sp. PCC 7003]